MHRFRPDNSHQDTNYFCTNELEHCFLSWCYYKAIIIWGCTAIKSWQKNAKQPDSAILTDACVFIVLYIWVTVLSEISYDVIFGIMLWFGRRGFAKFSLRERGRGASDEKINTIKSNVFKKWRIKRYKNRKRRSTRSKIKEQIGTKYSKIVKWQILVKKK